MFQLLELFSKKSAMRLLWFFMDNPSGESYRSEILKKVKVAKASSTKWLKRLVDDGFLLKTTKGKIVLYKLNSDYALVKELKKIKTIYTILPDVEKLAGVEFFLYGSCARGEEREESDIDLLVIGKRTEEIIKILSVLEKKTGRTVRASFYSQLEWSRTAREDPAFYERVEKDKIRLI
jgi:predicted nucleotidyltransferase